MILLYSSPGCASCRKAKQWLKDKNLPFVEKNIFSTILKEDEIKYLLNRSENGTEDLISTRSKAYQEIGEDVNDMSVKELVQFIQKNPSVLKRPIILSDKNIVVGYDDDEITSFVPKEARKVIEESCSLSCPNYPFCGAVRKECKEEA